MNTVMLRSGWRLRPALLVIGLEMFVMLAIYGALVITYMNTGRLSDGVVRAALPLGDALAKAAIVLEVFVPMIIIMVLGFVIFGRLRTVTYNPQNQTLVIRPKIMLSPALDSKISPFAYDPSHTKESTVTTTPAEIPCSEVTYKVGMAYRSASGVRFKFDQIAEKETGNILVNLGYWYWSQQKRDQIAAWIAESKPDSSSDITN